MKILLTSPAFFVFLLIAGAYLCRRHRRWRNALSALAATALLIFTWEPAFQWAARKWSEAYPWEVAAGKTYQYGIVLGGFSDWDWERNRPEFSANIDRLAEGIQLYHKGIIRKLIIASDGCIIQREDTTKQSGNPEAMTVYLQRLGIPREDLILETKATTTHENATTIRALLTPSPEGRVGERPLLITSAIHMRRSLMAFRQVGIDPDPYVTDCVVRVKGREGHWLPALHVMHDWQALLHEIIGYAIYQLRW